MAEPVPAIRQRLVFSQRFRPATPVSPVRVGFCDVDARQGDDGQAGGSGVAHRVVFRRERPAPVPLLLCLSP